ncbi:MAG: putative transcriptional regulator [Firmicutes bacterium]|nr:putative transcriptional regulator [Bacillota bacterium]
MEQVLSNIEVLLLSIINEKPSYAYEIDKIIDNRDMRKWNRIGVASIYQVLKRLEDKEFVVSQIEKEGKMPDRKRYYITDSGKQAQIQAAKYLLSNFEWFYLDLNVGLESSDCLTEDEIANCLMQRLAKVKANLNRVQEISSYSREPGFKAKGIVKTLMYFREAEERFLLETINDLYGDKGDLLPAISEDLYLFPNNLD